MQMRRNPRLEAGRFALVIAFDHLAHRMQSRDHIRFVMRHIQLQELANRAYFRSQRAQQLGNPFTG